jgi:hypothetical protein
MAISPDVLRELTPQPYHEVRDEVRDGDILLCSAYDPFSKLIRWGTHSPWSHVAIAFRIDELNRIMVLECIEKLGVRAVPLSGFISRTSSGKEPYPGQIVLVRHGRMAVEPRRQLMEKMATFAFDRLGAPFSQAEVLKIVLRIVLNRFRVKLHPSLGPKDEFICSEFVARCFETVGVTFPWDGCGFIAPSDIAADPALAAVAQIRT